MLYRRSQEPNGQSQGVDAGRRRIYNTVSHKGTKDDDWLSQAIYEVALDAEEDNDAMIEIFMQEMDHIIREPEA
jgi:hypothetical protein